MTVSHDRPTLMQCTKKFYASIRFAELAPSLYDHERWHTMFHILKQGNTPWKELLDDLKFDWDGPSPRSPQLTRILHTFRVACGAGMDHIEDGLLEYWNERWTTCTPAEQSAMNAMIGFASELLKPYSTHASHNQCSDRRVGVLSS